MNTWVEWWEIPTRTSASHAQMSENIPVFTPDPKKVYRRFFDTDIKAQKYARIMADQGYHATVKHDRSF